MNETQFKKKVQQFLTDIGAWHVKFMGTQYTPSGIPDILACIHGRFYGIELKTDHGIVSPLQLRQLEKIRQAGGQGILLRPSGFDDFRKEVLAWIHSATAESNNGTNADSAGT